MSTCGVLPAVTLHCMGEQEATAVASIAATWQLGLADLQQRTASSSSCRCVNPQSDSLVPSAGMTSHAPTPKPLVLSSDHLGISSTTPATTAAQATSTDSFLSSQLQADGAQAQAAPGKAGWSSVVVFGSGLSVTAMAGAHMAAYGSPSALLDLLTSLGFMVDARVVDASVLSLWQVPGAADTPMHFLLLLLCALCAAAAATLKLSPLPSVSVLRTVSTDSTSATSSSSSSSSSGSVSDSECDGSREQRNDLGAESPLPRSASIGSTRPSTWFSFSLSGSSSVSSSFPSSFSSSPASSPSSSSRCTPPPTPCASLVAVEDSTADSEGSTGMTDESSSSSSDGGYLSPVASKLKRSSSWFSFSPSFGSLSGAATAAAAAAVAATPPPTPSSSWSQSEPVAMAGCEDGEEDEVTSAPVRGLDLVGSRSLNSITANITTSSSSSSLSRMSSMSSIGSASASAWSNVAQWSQSLISASPVAAMALSDPSDLIRTFSQLISTATRSVSAQSAPRLMERACADDGEEEEVSSSLAIDLSEAVPTFIRLCQDDGSMGRVAVNSSCSSIDRQQDLSRPVDLAAVQSELREASAAVNSADLADLLLRLDWSYSDEQGAWEEILDKSCETLQYKAWRRDPRDGGPTEYHSRVSFLHCSARDLCTFYTDCSFLPTWDSMLKSYEPRHACPDTGVHTARFERKYPFCAPREYVLAWRVWEQQQQPGEEEEEDYECSASPTSAGELFYCITKAVEDEGVPRKHKPKRVELYRSGWRVKDVVLPGGVRAAVMEMVVQEDSGMNRDMAKIAYRRGAWGYIRSTDSHLRTYISKHLQPQRQQQQSSQQLVVASATADKTLPPMAAVQKVPLHLLPCGSLESFHARCLRVIAGCNPHEAAADDMMTTRHLTIACRPGADADASFPAAAASAKVEEVEEESGSRALVSAGREHKEQGLLQQLQQSHHQQGRRIRPLRALRRLLGPAAKAAAVGVGGGLLLVASSGAAGAVSKVLLVYTLRCLVLRPPRSPAV